MIGDLTVALLAQAIGSAFVCGAFLLLILAVLPATRAAANQLWPLLASEAAILAAGVAPWLMPSAVLFAILLVVAARIGFESGTVHGLTVNRNLKVPYSVILVLVSGFCWFADSRVFISSAVMLLVIAAAGTAMGSERTLLGSLSRFTLFPLLPLAGLSHTAAEPDLGPVLVLAFFLVEMFDSFSLLGGKLYGRTPLVPKLSPRKTWEGFATGVTATTIAIGILTVWLHLNPLVMMAAGVVVVIMAIVGDLLGSLAKRHAGVKDYPTVMTVQGGLLDITDAWLVAGPCLAVLTSILARS